MLVGGWQISPLRGYQISQLFKQDKQVLRESMGLLIFTSRI